MFSKFVEPIDNDLDPEIDDFYPTNDWASCEKSHGASDGWQLVLKGCGFVFCYSHKGSCVKINSDISQV